MGTAFYCFFVGLFLWQGKHTESRSPSAFDHTNAFRPGLINHLFLLLLTKSPEISAYERDEKEPTCAASSTGMSPRPLSAVVPDPRDTSWDSLRSPCHL